VSSYQLYAADTARHLGSHSTYEAACLAADEYTLNVLAVAADWVTVETWVVGPGLDGPLTLHPVVTHIGPPSDLERCRRWLEGLRCRARDERS
jgi:hypothetical protein